MSDQRLSRMEDKLDKLSEAIISMARIEDRLVSADKRMHRIDDLFKKFDERMDDIERQAIAEVRR
jgi:vacuolar-type H+-ATPase subunit E/Vma4